MLVSVWHPFLLHSYYIVSFDQSNYGKSKIFVILSEPITECSARGAKQQLLAHDV
jgi:hypothetical protein